MKEYQKPTVEEETIVIEDVIAESGTFGENLAGDNPINPFGN